MAETRKKVRFTLRMRTEQRQKLERAAQIESARRPSAIEAGPLALELLMPGVEQILQRAEGQADTRRSPDRRGTQ